MKIYVVLTLFLFLTMQANLYAEDAKNEGEWYKVDDTNDINSIYVNYKSIDKKDEKVKYEQMEFLLEKQKLEGTDKEYKFIVSKRISDCKNKKYLVKEDKYYDVEVNDKKKEIKDELVFKTKFENEPDENWITVIPNTLIEKVWRFTCLYKKE